MSQTGIEGKVVVITGAARGLGLGMATRFSQAGAHVVITDVDAVAGREATARLYRGDLAVTFEPLDVRVPEQSIAVVDRTIETFGRIDVWVNNAGISHLGAAEELPLERWNDCLDVILSGTFYCCQAVGRSMLPRAEGVIVNVASVTGIKPIEGRVSYSVPKAGVIALTKQLGIEWARRGIRVVGVAPAVVETDMVRQGAEQGHFDIDACVRRTPLRRLGQVEEIAESVLYLASDEASYITGETLQVDGGWVAYQLF